MCLCHCVHVFVCLLCVSRSRRYSSAHIISYSGISCLEVVLLIAAYICFEGHKGNQLVLVQLIEKDRQCNNTTS